MDREHIQYTCDSMCQIFRNLEFKLIGLLLPLYGFFYGDIEKQIALGLAVLIMFRFLTGISAAKFTGKPIESSKVFVTALRFCIYFVLISAGHLAEQTNPTVLGFVDDSIVGWLAMTELIAIIENAGEMGMGLPQKLLNKLKDLRDN